MSQAKVLTESEFKRLLAVAKSTSYGKRNSLLIFLSFYAGMRASEISSLKLSHIVNHAGHIRDRINLSSLDTKGNNPRTVIISTKLQRKLNEFIFDGQKRNLSSPLIKSQKGGHFSPTTMVMLFRKLYDAAGLSTARSHSGRRTFITNLANNGINVRLIQALAGHKNLQTTQVYIEINDDLLAKAIEAI
jgi:integrase/recombinase XerD